MVNYYDNHTNGVAAVRARYLFFCLPFPDSTMS
jgi:hypothetical protein